MNMLDNLDELRRRARNDRHAYGWYQYWPLRMSAVWNMLLPGVILLVGGVAALVGKRR